MEGVLLALGNFLTTVAMVVVPALIIWGMGILIFRLFVYFQQRKWLQSLEFHLFEISIPQDVPKSPLAMELVLGALHQGGGAGTWKKRWIEGKVVLPFSLEIVSINGNVRFFIRVQNKFKDYVESQIYAQYPQAEITEVDDYTLSIPPITEGGPWEQFGTEFVLTAPDPYPIATYRDYGLDLAVGSLDEEQKVDPLTTIIEFFASLKQDEQMWLQFIVRKHTTGKDLPILRKKDRGKWGDDAKELVQSLTEQWATDEDGKINVNQLTNRKKDIIAAVERSAESNPFDVGIRCLYWGKGDAFDGRRIGAMTGMFRPFSGGTNGFAPDARTITDFDFTWQDPSGRKLFKRKQTFQDLYAQREFFYKVRPYWESWKNIPFVKVPKQVMPFVLNQEELATLFHFPGKVSQTPTLARVNTRKAEPPSNLPI